MFGRPTHGVQEHSSPEAQYYRWPIDCKHAGLTVEERLDENEEEITTKILKWFYKFQNEEISVVDLIIMFRSKHSLLMIPVATRVFFQLNAACNKTCFDLSGGFFRNQITNLKSELLVQNK